MKIILLTVSLTFLVACVQGNSQVATNLKKATFAGGCFWCMESPFEHLDGVQSVVSGYTGGHVKNPTYADVGAGKTGHLESIEIIYDPAKISYQQLLDIYWRQLDPTDAGGSFYDRGSQYTSAIFYHDEEQKELAETSKKALEASGRFDKPIVTVIRPATTFYPAEDYHQDYYLKNPEHYKSYRAGSGRDAFIKKFWWGDQARTEKYGKPSDAVLRQKLTALQYEVTQKEGTERPFQNEYWHNEKSGIYVDIVSGEPLFNSTDKFDSGTGWPSFTRPLAPKNIAEKKDRTLGMTRIEVRSKHGDSHLGHVFDDGPAPTGVRYCINSAALRFIPKEDLAKEGYAEYEKLFK